MEEDRELLLEYLKENLAHARHVEGERMTFNALFAALVGGAFGIMTQIESVVTTVAILCLLILVNVVCLALTERWSDVFAGHHETAKRLHRLIVGYSADINAYYIFDNKAAKNKKHYISTRKYFKYFNYMILLILLATLFGVVYQEFGGTLFW